VQMPRIFVSAKNSLGLQALRSRLASIALKSAGDVAAAEPPDTVGLTDDWAQSDLDKRETKK
jgi:hypothetical protein